MTTTAIVTVAAIKTRVLSCVFFYVSLPCLQVLVAKLSMCTYNVAQRCMTEE